MSTKSPVWVAAHYAIGDDAASVTWGTEDTAVNVENMANFRLRVRVAETNAANTANVGSWVLQYIVNGGTPATVGAATAVKYVDSTHVTDGTTNFAGFLTDIVGAAYDQTWNEQDENNSVTSQTWSDTECEYEYSLNLNSVAVGNTITFRMLSPSTSTAVTFDNIPTLTVVPRNTNIAGAVGSGTFAGSAPTLLQTNNWIAVPGAGSGAFAGSVPTLDVKMKSGGYGLLLFGLNLVAASGVTRAPGVGSGTFAGLAPTLAQTANQWIDIGAGTGTFAGSAPTLAQTANQWIDTGAGNPSDLTGYAPTADVTAHQWITPDAGAGTFGGYAPTLAQTANHWIDVGLGSGAFSGADPVSQNGNSWTAVPDAGSGTFAGSEPTLAKTAHQWIDVGTGTLTGAGSAPVVAATAHQWITPDVGAGTFSGEVPTFVEETAGTLAVPAGSGAFTGTAPTAVTSTTTETVEDAPVGGWRRWFSYEQDLLRREEERRRLEDAVEAEIAARMTGGAVVPAEDAAPEYLADLRALVAASEREAEFRQFVDGLRIAQQESELARLMSIDRAIREYVRRRKEEEEFIQILLMAA